MKYNILVTGCGGDIGQSIGKILNDSVYVKKLYGCDVSKENAGMFIYSNFMIGPLCHDENYFLNLKEVIKSKEVDLVIPIAEPELRFLSENGVCNKIENAKLIMASNKALEVGFDKLKTAEFLESEGLLFPYTKPVKSIEDYNQFPVILKSRTGSGSSQVFILKDEEELNFFSNKYPDYIIQEHLDGTQGEFTCGVFRSESGIIRTIILKRKLTGGFSGYGIVVNNESINELLIKIAEKLDLVGSINVQLRLTERGPIVFEINPRFSSTVLFRHMLGFKDLLWSIEDKLGLEISPFDNNSEGKQFYKGFNEYIS